MCQGFLNDVLCHLKNYVSVIGGYNKWENKNTETGILILISERSKTLIK